jgi:ubiquinone biosynthesis protein COQ9
LIFWLEDDSTNFIKTREFVTRRIADVMMLERIKGTIKKSPLLGQFVEQFEFLANGMIESREKFPGWQGK